MPTAAPEPEPAPSLADVASRLEAEADAEAGKAVTVPAVVSSSSAPAPAPASRSQRAARRPDGAMLGGVCSGLAAHLGWPVLAIRMAFMVLGLWQFLGVFLYGLLWLVLPLDAAAEEAPGLEAAERTGMRTTDGRQRRADVMSVVGLALISVGLLWLLQLSGYGWSEPMFWPFALGAVGVSFIWRQADAARTAPGRWPRWIGWLRTGIGLVFVAAALVVVIATRVGMGQLPRTLAIGIIGILALLVVVAPWVYHSRSALSAARERQIVTEARADMAAHLHDSVLQTLALIQRQSDDPKAVATLARRQERELRAWLYDDVHDASTMRSALARAASKVEDERGIPVDLVVVGDHDMDASMDAVVQAAREAMLNAAKHSGAERVDVYAEITEASAEVFVRDRGAGFDAGAVGEDRMGIRGSIVDRMARHGGSATIRTAPGEGTEVRLEMHG